MSRSGTHSAGEVPEEFRAVDSASNQVSDAQREAIAAAIDEARRERRAIPPSLVDLYAVKEVAAEIAATETVRHEGAFTEVPAIAPSIHPDAEHSGRVEAVRRSSFTVQLTDPEDGAKLREMAVQAGFHPGVVERIGRTTFRVNTRPSR